MGEFKLYDTKYTTIKKQEDFKSSKNKNKKAGLAFKKIPKEGWFYEISYFL